MNKVHYFIGVFLIVVFQIACTGQTEQAETNIKHKLQEKREQVRIRKIDNRDIDHISVFIDTARLPRFYAQISHFIQDDSLHPQRKVDIVFSGSSSIRKWETLQQDMHELNVLNRGFGGSTVPEAVYYADVLFFKHHPEKIVFYSGDNDIALLRWDTDRVFKSFKYFYEVVHSNMPETKIYFISLKPSPGRMRFWDKMKIVNDSLKAFTDTCNFAYYIDGASCLLDENGQIKAEFFQKDGVHLNAKGYKLWADIIYNAIKED